MSVSSQKRFMQTRQLAICAFLCALQVVFARFTTVMPSSIARFSIEAVPIILAGYFYGPVSGMMVGFVGDTVGCLFSTYGWNPIISVSPMLMGVFAGLLRRIAYKVEKPWDIWKVALTILPGKVFGSIAWTSLCFVWLGFSSKGLGVLMATRTVESLLEWALDTVIVMLLLRLGLFRRLGLFPPAAQDRRSASYVLRLICGLVLLLQIVLLSLGDVFWGLDFLNNTLSVDRRLASGAMYLWPTVAAVALFAAAQIIKKRGDQTPAQ